MAYLWEEMEDQSDRTHFSPRVTKDVVEEELFHLRRDLFSGHDMVFFDTTSLYFEGAGRKTIGHSKDHRHDLHQMIVGVILDNEGNPLCSKMWPGNAADVKSLIPVMDRLGRRFAIRKFCIVSDRGMISKETMAYLEQERIPYILGARMRMVKEIKEEVPSRAGRYREVRPKSVSSKDPSPLKVKEVMVDNRSLREKLASNPKSLVGNKGYRKYLAMDHGAVSLNEQKIEHEARFNGKWVLITNAVLTAEQAALKYKEL